MPAVTDITRKAVWDTMCDLEWYIRYYRAMSDRRRRAHLLLRFALLMGVAIEGGILYSGTLYPWLFYLGIVGGLVLAGLTFWDVLTNYAGDIEVCRMVSETCSLLMREADTLWRNIETGRVSEADVEATLGSIHSRWDWAYLWVRVPVDQSLNMATAQAANAEMERRYGS